MNNQLTMTDGIQSLLNEYRDLKADIQIIESRCDDVKNKIQELLGDRQEIVNTEGTVIATYKVIEAERFDNKQFKEAFPDIYKKYSKVVVGKRFVLKEFE